MFQGFQPFTITTQTSPEVRIFGIKSGNSSSGLPPLLLLHGCPQSHHIWHRVVEKIVDNYTVIAVDIRGYGASSKPGGIASYAKSAMARDCVKVMDYLGYSESQPFFVCAHDRGARVAHKLCVDYPDRVRKAIFLDICPTLVMYKNANFDFAKAYFHWFFLIQQAPLPETLINATPRRFVELFMGGFQQTLDVFERENFEYYVSVLENPAAVDAMCNEYRASATLDLDEAEADLEAGKLIRSPLLVLWGKHGVIEKLFDAVKEWREVAERNVPVDGYAIESGHFLPEQAPDEVVRAITDFFV